MVPPPSLFLSVISSSLSVLKLSLLHSSPLLPHRFPFPLQSTFLTKQGMANTMVSLRSSELGPLSWDAVTKRQLFLQKVSSKLGPNARPQGRGVRLDKGSSGTGLPGQGHSGPQQAHSDGSTLREDGQKAEVGSLIKARPSQTQSQGESVWFPHTVNCKKHELFQYRHTSRNLKPTKRFTPDVYACAAAHGAAG